MEWTNVSIYQSTIVHVVIKAFQAVSWSRIAACTIVSGAIEQVGYGNPVVIDSCIIINITNCRVYHVRDSPMLALHTTVTTRRKNGKEFKGMQVATILLSYNIMEIVWGIYTVLSLHVVKKSGSHGQFKQTPFLQ